MQQEALLAPAVICQDMRIKRLMLTCVNILLVIVVILDIDEKEGRHSERQSHLKNIAPARHGPAGAPAGTRSPPARGPPGNTPAAVPTTQAAATGRLRHLANIV